MLVQGPGCLCHISHLYLLLARWKCEAIPSLIPSEDAFQILTTMALRSDGGAITGIEWSEDLMAGTCAHRPGDKGLRCKLFS